MYSKVSHNCGIVVTHTLHDAYSMIRSLQHRGREAAGIAAIGQNVIDVIKWKGGVSRFDLTDLYKILDSSKYNMYMAHVRYATRGRKEEILNDAHPHVIGGRKYDKGSHVIIKDCEAAIVHNGTIMDDILSCVDRSACKTGCDSEALLHMYYKYYNEEGIMRRVPGSYTAAIAHKNKNSVIVMRDRTGMKPGVVGWKDGKYIVASEDIAFRKNGADFQSDLQPGCIYYLYPNGKFEKRFVMDPEWCQCFFEYNYLADVESIIDGLPVRSIREHFADKMIVEFPFHDLDFVTFTPRCPEVTAMRYAELLGVPFEFVFYKMRQERAFQGSNKGDRRVSIDNNLFLNIDSIPVIQGKKGANLDDSTVRGNNIKREKELFEEAGVKKVIHINYTPEIGIIGEDGVPRGCVYGGVDMAPDDDFIARDDDSDPPRNRTPKEISEIAGMDVRYLSLESMLSAFEDFGKSRKRLCHFCVGGPDPFVKYTLDV